MPGLARLSLVEYYLFQFLFHLDQDDRVNALNVDQRRAIVQLLDFINETMHDKITENVQEDEMSRVKGKLTQNV